jgi:hypothetical protein
MKTLSLSSLLCGTLIAFAAACGGGGGGGDDFVGAATVGITLQPSSIDSGDRTQVTVDIGDVHDNGIALKIRFPNGLRYVPSSASLLVDEQQTKLTPTVNALAEDENSIYLVFYLSQSLFSSSGDEYNGQVGTLRLQLEGRKAVKDGTVEVDADVDDPQESNDSEFSISTPEFAAEDEASIEVIEG